MFINQAMTTAWLRSFEIGCISVLRFVLLIKLVILGRRTSVNASLLAHLKLEFFPAFT